MNNRELSRIIFVWSIWKIADMIQKSIKPIEFIQNISNSYGSEVVNDVRISKKYYVLVSLTCLTENKIWMI